MAEKPGLEIDVKSCSTQQLVELARQLRGSSHNTVLRDIQRELVERARTAGRTNQQIVDALIMGMTETERKAIAKEWCAALGVSEEEFKRLANVK